MAREIPHVPLVYSCSGCSSLGQLTNTLAQRLDRDGEAQMSCIVGVGGDIPNFVRQATSGRPILALDGCPLACVRNSLKRHNVVPDEYVLLQSYGFKKRYGEDVAEDEVERIYPKMVRLARKISPELAVDMKLSITK